MRTCQNGAQIAPRPKPDRTTFIRRMLDRHGRFVGIDGDPFHRIAQRLAADPDLELVDCPQPFRQGGKLIQLPGWLLRRRR